MRRAGRAIHFSDNDGDDDDGATAIEFTIKGAPGAERQKNKAPPSLSPHGHLVGQEDSASAKVGFLTNYNEHVSRGYLENRACCCIT